MDKLSEVCSEGLQFIQSLLAWSISERLSPSQALAHPYLAEARGRGKENRMQMIVQHLLALSSINSPTTGQSVSTPDALKQNSNVKTADSKASARAESCASDMSLGLHKLQVVF